jgi:hypothetical protein
MSKDKNKIKRKINSIIRDLESATADLELLQDDVMDKIEEAEEEELGVEDIIEWFKSPFVSDYDKQTVLKQIKNSI